MTTDKAPESSPKAPATVVLENRTRGLVVLNLPHGVVPEAATMGVLGTFDHVPATGARVVTAHKRPISGSITLLAHGNPDGDDAVEVPRTALNAPEVKAALTKGTIGIREEEDADGDTKPQGSNRKGKAPGAPGKQSVPAELSPENPPQGNPGGAMPPDPPNGGGTESPAVPRTSRKEK